MFSFTKESHWKLNKAPITLVTNFLYISGRVSTSSKQYDDDDNNRYVEKIDSDSFCRHAFAY